MRVLLCIVLGSVAVIVSGCTSIVAHRLMSPFYFGGVRCDSGAIKESLDPQSDRPALESIYYAIDMPFSLGADIIYIPYDVYADIKSSHRTNAVVDLGSLLTNSGLK
jgi:uncharacterized protein YceK